MTQQPTPQTSAPRPRGRGIAIATAVVGGAVLFGLGASAAIAMAVSSRDADTVQAEGGPLRPVDVGGVTSLDVTVGVAELDLVFGDVDAATLSASQGAVGRWEFSRSGDELVVRAPKTSTGWCIFGVCPSQRGQHVRATLTLPQELAGKGLDADISIGFGSVRAVGDFGELDVKVDAGEASVNGSARELGIEVGLGTFEGEIAGASTVEARVELGDVSLALGGDPPTDVELNVSAGSIDLAVPAGQYDLSSKNSAGSIDSSLQTAPGAPNRISAKVELGDITLREVR